MSLPGTNSEIHIYENDSVGLTKKTIFLYDFYVMRPLFWLSIIAQESQQSASRGRVLTFYRITPCLNTVFFKVFTSSVILLHLFTSDWRKVPNFGMIRLYKVHRVHAKINAPR